MNNLCNNCVIYINPHQGVSQITLLVKMIMLLILGSFTVEMDILKHKIANDKLENLSILAKTPNQCKYYF